jgi:putative spermidine/putrescine transport system permease protein
MSRIWPRPGAIDRYKMGWHLVFALAIALVLFMVVPTLFVIPVSLSPTRFLEFPPEGFSLRWYHRFFAVPEWTKAVVYSIAVASLTMLTALLIGVPAAFGLTRGRFHGRRIVTILLILPLVLPLILIAVAEYFFLIDLELNGTTAGVVVAHTVLALPFVVILVSATLRGFDRTYEQAAMSLGANPLQTLWHVTLPMIQPGILSAALFAFLASFGEFIVALFVVGTRTVTLPIQMWKGIRFETDPTIAAAASLILATSAGVLLLIEVIRRSAQAYSISEPASITEAELPKRAPHRLK